MRFWDSSALIPLCVEERYSKMVQALMVRLAAYWTEITPSEEVRMTARRLLLRHPLRAADSLQLAAALVWSGGQPEHFDFVCMDNRLREAARAEGFVLQPSRME